MPPVISSRRARGLLDTGCHRLAAFCGLRQPLDWRHPGLTEATLAVRRFDTSVGLALEHGHDGGPLPGFLDCEPLDRYPQGPFIWRLLAARCGLVRRPAASPRHPAAS